MDPEQAATTARALVASRFPRARAAWLAGSVVSGGATSTSDLDITVLVDDDAEAPFRESLLHDGQPVELFVHTRESIELYVRKDLLRRRPTMARLVSSGVLLVDDDDGTGARLSARCAGMVAAGPGPLDGAERDRMRYGLTDLLDDLEGGTDRHERAAVSIALWQQAVELVLAAGGRWSGTGKWLVRELAAYDDAHGTQHSTRLHSALLTAIHGETSLLTTAVEEILADCGGRLWAGYRAGG